MIDRIGRQAVLIPAILFISVSWVCHADPGQTLQNADVRQEPYLDAALVGTLPANSALDIVKRQGGWLQVKSSAASGWVKMSSVRLATVGTATSGDNGLGSLVNVARTGRSGNTGVTVATGVRGLSAEDLKNASPNPVALKKMDAYPGGKGEAQAFADSGKLQSQRIDYLAESKPSTSGSSFFGGSRK